MQNYSYLKLCKCWSWFLMFSPFLVWDVYIQMIIKWYYLLVCLHIDIRSHVATKIIHVTCYLASQVCWKSQEINKIIITICSLSVGVGHTNTLHSGNNCIFFIYFILKHYCAKGIKLMKFESISALLLHDVCRWSFLGWIW